MASFPNAVLKLLPRIFRFDSEKVAPDSVDLALPVATVLDVSRLAERGRGFGPYQGFREAHMLCVAAGGGTEFAYIDVLSALQTQYEPLLPTEGEVEGWDIWLCSASFQHTTSTFPTEICLSLSEQIKTAGGAATRRETSLLYCESTDFDTFRGVAGQIYLNKGGNLSPGVTLPRLLQDSARIYVKVIHAAAGTVTCWFSLWAGPKGTAPPGMY